MKGQRDMSASEPSSVDRAVTHGMDIYRAELEDENQHIEDAVRIGMRAAVSKALVEARSLLDEAADLLAGGEHEKRIRSFTERTFPTHDEDTIPTTWTEADGLVVMGESRGPLAEVERLRVVAGTAVSACLPVMQLRGSDNSGYSVNPEIQVRVVAEAEEWADAAQAIADLHAALNAS